MARLGSIERGALYVSRQKEGAFQSYHKKLCSFSLGKAIERFSYLLQSLHTTQYVHTTKEAEGTDGMARYYTFEKQFFFVKQHFECLIASSIVSLSPPS